VNSIKPPKARAALTRLAPLLAASVPRTKTKWLGGACACAISSTLRCSAKKQSVWLPKKIGWRKARTAQEVEETLKLGEKIRGYICDSAELVNHALDEGKSVLFEGAQGTMLDIDHGTYPYVTSSSAISGGATTGAGVPPTKIKHVLGISKAYTTRVGGGPFPTEMPDLDAQEVRKRGKEFGAVTGRPRRCGWLDLAVLRYAKMINGIDSLVVTKLDVFDTQREIQVCVGYKYKGKPIHEMPALAEEYEHVTPEYKTLPGWSDPTYGVKDAGKLPKAALDYLRFIGDFLQVEIGMISTGPERDATIIPEATLLARWL